MNILEKLNNLQLSLEFFYNRDLAYFIENHRQIEDTEDLKDQLSDYLKEFANEGVYSYNEAMEYLKDNDPTLAISVGIALEMGCDLKNVTSEFLADILKTKKNRAELNTFLKSNAVKEIFDLFYKKN